MKKNRYYIIIVVLFLSIFSCSKEKMFVYEQRAGIYFESSTYSYTFIDNPGAEQITISLPVVITGDSVGYDREFTAVIPEKDTISTAESRMYSIGKGVVKAGQFNGSLKFTVNYTPEMDDSVYKVRLSIIPSKDFEEINLNRVNMVISFTNQIIKPANWSWLRWYFGTPYSTAWWKFIMEKTGKTSLPYFPTNPDKETWWMSAGEVIAYQSLVRIELEKYNAAHPKNPLSHDDGDYKDTPITMP